jgi:Protein phosphatase 2C
MLTVDVGASVGAGVVNEDIVGWAPTAAWVIDGATGVVDSLMPGVSDAAWFAGRASQLIADFLADDPTVATRPLLIDVMRACRRELEGSSVRSPSCLDEHPSAAFAMVRVLDGRVELSTLGDCRIGYMAPSHHATIFGTTELEKFERRTIELAKSIRAQSPDIGPDAFIAQLKPQLRENRRHMNRPDGYWVLGTESAAADHLNTTMLDASYGSRFFLASDGFLRLNELFQVASLDDLLGIETEASFTVWLNKLRDLERAPGSMTSYPRVKMHDDASFLSCRYVRED